MSAARSRFNITTLNEALTSTKARETRGRRPEPETSSTSVAQTRFSGCQESSRGREPRRLGPGADGAGRVVGDILGTGTWNLEGPPPAQIISFGEAAPSSSSPALNRHREGPERTNLRHSSHDLNETPRILKILPCHSCQLCGNEPHPTPILDRTVGASPGPKRFTQ